MRLPFLNRHEELARLRAVLSRNEGALGVLYGRRRCGKSRLLWEALRDSPAVYFVGDDREPALQRAGLAAEIGRRIPGFDDVTYPDWNALFSRWWDQAEPGSVLALDEFPAMVSVAREIPSLLQKHLDRRRARGLHLLLAGSSQRMMQGLVLDRSAPLFGRAQEVMEISPLRPGWIRKALGLRSGIAAVEAYALWGGVPRYWELAVDQPDLESAIRALVLSPLGVLHDEPMTLLLDDIRDVVQAASILALVGRGCHRLSEIAGRLGKPATSLSRPMQRLVELRLVQRQVPHGCSVRDTKRTFYEIVDPFLRFWFRFVEPNRSRLEARLVDQVASAVAGSFSHHVAGVWEELSRASVPHLACFGRSWRPAGRWWGAGLDRRPQELDIVAESDDERTLLLGEVKWADGANARELLAGLRAKAANFPQRRDREVLFGLWLKSGRTRAAGAETYTPAQVMRALE